MEKIDSHSEKSKSVKFRQYKLLLGKSQFELMLNMNLLDKDTRKGFSWYWSVTLKVFELDENEQPSDQERKNIMLLMQETIQRIMKIAEIRIVGTSLHKGVYDIMFYAQSESTKEIGGAITELPEFIEDKKGRFSNYNGNNDPNWEKVKNYYDATSKIG